MFPPVAQIPSLCSLSLRFAQRVLAQGADWPARNVRIACRFTPGGSQDPIARRLVTEKVQKEPDVIESMKIGGFEPGTLSVAEADAYIKTEHQRRGEVIRAAGIEPQ